MSLQQQEEDVSKPQEKVVQQLYQPQQQQQDSAKPQEKKVVAATNLKKKKRKRKPNSEEDDAILILKLQQERYDKLLYTAKKQIHKHAKKCKTFLVQKCVRSLKKQQQENVSNNSKLEGWKDLNLDLVVEQAIRQLGLMHANPNPETSLDTMSTPTTDTTDPLVTALLQHSRFQSVLEEWNQKVTEYRRWCLQWNERNDRFLEPKNKKKKEPPPQQQPMSLFCSLGGAEEEVIDKMAAYGPAAAFDEEPRKKNRQGQRGRRAKAMAIEAKKAGRGRDHQSLNWRSGGGIKREKKEEESGGWSEGGGKKTDAPPPPKEPEVQHPSWVAKQQQTSGIVAFQGTKITFD